MRMDPFRLPQPMSFTERDGSGEVTFTLDRRGVSIRRFLQRSGLPASVALPANAFRGVAASAVEDDEGHVTVTLELLHADPMLCVPLLVANDLDDIAVDWREWSDAYNLPMLLIEADGVARTLEESLGAVARSAGADRRQGRPTHARRPRFLARRKIGTLGVRLVVGGEPVIAAD
ncbi:MAG: hypothetical protein DI629_10965 [Mesorhizobium amorphae]|nr:MAG: hypothetical protein DI629_10965 [Mesorhizobium amorphae]